MREINKDTNREREKVKNRNRNINKDFNSYILQYGSSLEREIHVSLSLYLL